MDSNMPELDRKALKEALDVALLDLEAAAAPTKAEVFIRCGTSAGDLRDAIVSLRASLEEAEGRALGLSVHLALVREQVELAGVGTEEDRAAALERASNLLDLDDVNEALAERMAAEQRERRLREAATFSDRILSALPVYFAGKLKLEIEEAIEKLRAALSEEEA